MQIKQNNRACRNNIGTSLVMLITVTLQGRKLTLINAYCHLQQKLFGLSFLCESTLITEIHINTEN